MWTKADKGKEVFSACATQHVGVSNEMLEHWPASYVSNMRSGCSLVNFALRHYAVFHFYTISMPDMTSHSPGNIAAKCRVTAASTLRTSTKVGYDLM